MSTPENKSENILKWHFPRLDGGEAHGFADPLIQYFEGNHGWFVARETIQNSLDAGVPNRANPVKVIFENLELPVENIPGCEELKKRIEKVYKRVCGVHQKTEIFYRDAMDILGGVKLRVLKISDFNTVGLDGADNEYRGRWYRLVKSVGENELTGVGGGSFGIGKGAPFAASALRTVYYSTLNESGEYIFQGKTRLITHDYEGEEHLGVGFFGKNGRDSLREARLIPDGFVRHEQGTDVYVVGFIVGENWKEELLNSVIENFWMAIHSEMLEVEISASGQESIQIHCSNLKHLLEQYSPEPRGCLAFYRAVTEPSRKREANLNGLGPCTLYIRKAEGYPKKIVFMRKPRMSVFDKQYFKLPEPYAGVFICDNDEGNRILRGMEPPAHDKWDQGRDPEKGKEIWRGINEWIKETLGEMASISAGRPEDIPELDQYLPFDEEVELENVAGSIGSLETETSTNQESPFEVGVERKEFEDIVETAGKPQSSIWERGKGEGTGAGGDGSGEGRNAGNKKGGEEDGETLSRIDTLNLKFRSIAIRGKSGNIEYCLILESAIEQKGSLNIVATGDDENYPALIDRAEEWETDKIFEVHKATIKNIELKKGIKTKIKLLLNSKEKYALGVERYEN